MAELSIFEQQILAQFQADRDLLKRATIEWIQGGGGTQEQCAAMLEGIATPTPSIPDRTAMLGAYCAEVGGYSNLCLLCALYPLEILMQVAAELGRPLPSLGEVAYWEVAGNRVWNVAAAPDYSELPEARRDDVPSTDPRFNFVVERRVSGTVGGVLRTLRQPVTLEVADGVCTSTVGNWEVVS